MKRVLLVIGVVAVMVALTVSKLHFGHERRCCFAPPAVRRPQPKLMLWAWEVPEDLAALEPGKAGVAFLAREVLLSDRVTIRPRMQPLKLAPGTYTMAVVRIETAPGFVPKATTAAEVAAAIAEAQRGADAVQVDFDALASQRTFYADVLRILRERLPRETPLSITALMSWCGAGSWLRELPVNEAVPMMFRMGGPTATRAVAPRSTAGIDDGPCNSSVGIAADEVWPEIAPQKRVYVFRPGSWTQDDVAKMNSLGYQGLRQ